MSGVSWEGHEEMKTIWDAHGEMGEDCGEKIGFREDEEEESYI